MNRLKKLFVVCITIRTLFVFIVKNAPTNYIPYLGYLGLIPSLGFMYQYFFSSKKGALGGKLLGAGGGGFFLLYVPYEKQKKFVQYFKKFVHIPFNFENLGSKIIFDQQQIKVAL